jgi:hypothetical protein
MLRVHMPFLVASGGSGALIYYQGSSEPETADFIKQVLKPGMVFVDVGAHLGEYSILTGAILWRNPASLQGAERAPILIMECEPRT